MSGLLIPVLQHKWRSTRRTCQTFIQMAPFKIEMGDDSSVTAHGNGGLKLVTVVWNEEILCSHRRVLYFPELEYNLLSVSVTDRLCFKIEVQDGVCRNKKGASVITERTINNELYILGLSQSRQLCGIKNSPLADMKLCHLRMAHIHTDGTRTMSRNEVVRGINVTVAEQSAVCAGCMYGKSKQARISQQGGPWSEAVLDLVHTDVCRPFPAMSLGKSKFFFCFS